MGGTIRFFDPTQEEYYVESIRRVVEHTALAYGATAELIYEKKVPPTINDAAASELAERVVIDTLGKENFPKCARLCLAKTLHGTYKKNQGGFAFIGIQNPEVGATFDHHNNRFYHGR